MERLVYNALRTPDGTVIVSRHRHDFVSHKDASGGTYFVDGGLDYSRRSVGGPGWTDMSVFIEDGIELVREVVEWGTRGKDGTEPLRLVKLKDMTSEHIQACLDTQHQMHPHLVEAFKLELKYRKTGKA